MSEAVGLFDLERVTRTHKPSSRSSLHGGEEVSQPFSFTMSFLSQHTFPHHTLKGNGANTSEIINEDEPFLLINHLPQIFCPSHSNLAKTFS